MDTKDKEMLEKLHGVLLELMMEFDRICRENEIEYSIAYGTLLGAVRHGGFIPWDDDVDIIMTRENYEKFCKICPESIDDRFFFQSKNTEPLYNYNIARLRKENTALIYTQWKNAGFNMGIYIDIFPVDEIPDSKWKRFWQYSKIIFCTLVRATRNKSIFMNRNMGHKIVNKIMYFCFNLFPKKFCDKIEYKAITKYNGKGNKLMAIICEGGNLIHTPKDLIPFTKEYLAEYEDIDFAGYKMRSIVKRDQALTHWYGDYMQLPPEDQQKLTHHPEVCDTEKSYKEYLNTDSE